MFIQRRSFSNNKITKESINNSSEDEQIKQIIKEINRDNKNTCFFQYKSPTKIRSFIRNRSTFASSNLRTPNRISYFKDNRENSLSFKLKDKITKETLILELREELKYHLKSNTVYNNFLNKIIHLKDIVKENRDKLEQNTEVLKETFSERFNIIEKYEKSIVLLGKEKADIIEENEEIYKLKQNTNEKLLKQYHEIQANNINLKEKIDQLDFNINDLEYQKKTLQDDLEKQYEADKENYENLYKNYQYLIRIYNYYTEEYNSYAKSGNEITKLNVKLNDETFARSLIIKEDLEIKLNDRLIENSILVENMNNLKKEIKIIEDKQQEEKANKEKKKLICF